VAVGTNLRDAKLFFREPDVAAADGDRPPSAGSARTYVLVHAVDEVARSFYLHYGFEASPSDPMNLQFLIKDIRATIEAGADEPTD
jgi:hypothetical protein